MIKLSVKASVLAGTLGKIIKLKNKNQFSTAKVISLVFSACNLFDYCYLNIAILKDCASDTSSAVNVDDLPGNKFTFTG